MTSYICDHFTSFTGSNLAEELNNQDFRHLPGEVSDIPGGDKEYFPKNYTFFSLSDVWFVFFDIKKQQQQCFVTVPEAYTG